MLKKMLIVGAIAAAVVVGLKATRVGTFVKNEAKNVVSWAEEQIPVEKKIASLRQEVASLDKDIDAVKNELAKQIVAQKELSTKTNELRASIDTEHKGLLARGEELKDATEKVRFGSTFISVADAKERLKRDVQVHLSKKKSLEAYEKSLGNREKIVETLQKQFEALKKQKDDMKAEIDMVEAEYKALQLQQMESRYQTDDTRLAQVKESLRQLKTKLDVEKTKLELEPKKYTPANSSNTSVETVDDILKVLNDAEKIDAAK